MLLLFTGMGVFFAVSMTATSIYAQHQQALKKKAA